MNNKYGVKSLDWDEHMSRSKVSGGSLTLQSYTPQTIYNLIPSRISSDQFPAGASHVLGVARDSDGTYALIQSNGGAQFYYQGSHRVDLPSVGTSIYLLQLFSNQKPVVQKIFNLSSFWVGELGYSSFKIGPKIIGATYEFQENDQTIHHLALINRAQISEFVLLPVEGAHMIDLFPFEEGVYLVGSGEPEIKIGETSYSGEGMSNLIVGKMNSNLEIEWVVRSQDISSSSQIFYQGGSLTPDHNLAMTGSFIGEINLTQKHIGYDQFESMFWGIVDSKGKWIHSKAIRLATEPQRSNFNTFNTSHVRGLDLTIDRGGIHLVGSFKGDLTPQLNREQVTYFYRKEEEIVKEVQLLQLNRSDLRFSAKVRVKNIGDQVVIGSYFDTMACLNGILYRNKGGTALLLFTPEGEVIRHLETNNLSSRDLIFDGFSLDSLIISANLKLYSARIHSFIIE